MKNSHGIGYRPEIDGLRAVAVMGVLLFHARLGLSGGFVGVDVFFVISGYLITSIILNDSNSIGGFRILGFWERRIRRILPAFFVVVVATAVGGWFILLPSDFQDLGDSILVQAVFGGNIYFWLTRGYFDTATSTPLLHTWSLAVEEQFYLLFPLLFLFGAKLRSFALLITIGCLAGASFALSLALNRFAPSAGFYLLPSRAWELLGGALLAFAPRTLNAPRWAGEALGWCGLLAIASAFALFDETTGVPAAIIPCAGAAAIIWGTGLAQNRSSLACLLSLRPVVLLGKLSYSLYLWHLPILIYAEYWAVNPIRWPFRIGLLLLSILFAMASWKLVETPFRTRRVLSGRRPIFAFGAASQALVLLVGVVIVLGHGMPARFPEAVVKYASGKSDFAFRLNVSLDSALLGTLPHLGIPDHRVHCLVWGDSHGMAVLPAFDALGLEFSSSVEVATHYATAPIMNYENRLPKSIGRDSKAWSDAVIRYVRAHRIAHVVLAARWRLYASDGTDASADSTAVRLALSARIAATTIELRRAGASVWILKEVPTQPVRVPLALAIAAMSEGKLSEIGITKQSHMELSQIEDEILAPAVENGAIILDPSPFFFSGRESCQVEASGHPLYVDRNHLSSHGAMLLLDLFRPIWEDRKLKHVLR